MYIRSDTNKTRSESYQRRNGRYNKPERLLSPAGHTSTDREHRWWFPEVHLPTSKPCRRASRIGPSSTRYKPHSDRSPLPGPVPADMDRRRPGFHMRRGSAVKQTGSKRPDAVRLRYGVLSPGIPRSVMVKSSVVREQSGVRELQPELTTELVRGPETHRAANDGRRYLQAKSRRKSVSSTYVHSGRTLHIGAFSLDKAFFCSL